MKYNSLLLLVLLISITNSFSQTVRHNYNKIRVHVKDEITLGPDWRIDASKNTVNGTVEIKLLNANKYYSITIKDNGTNNVRFSSTFSLDDAILNKQLNLYQIKCINDIDETSANIVLSSLNIKTLRYAGYMYKSRTEKTMGSIFLMIFYFDTNSNPF